jgi:hypothetical protein
VNETEQKHQQQDQETVAIDINLTRGMVVLLVVALMAVAFVGYLAQGRQEAVASPAVVEAQQASSGGQKYYMTGSAFLGNQAATACSAGYHMASLWEIIDTSNLEYNVDLGAARGDSGQGPPSGHAGWVHTGYDATVSDTLGQANCNGWTSNDTNHYGTAIARPSNWSTVGTFGAIADWDAITVHCDSGGVLVWCVED